jgi:hypothetical protein
MGREPPDPEEKGPIGAGAGTARMVGARRPVRVRKRVEVCILIEGGEGGLERVLVFDGMYWCG